MTSGGHLRTRRERGKLLMPYLTGGSGRTGPTYLRAFAAAGADAIEIGLPFSDPTLDGATIQEATDAALARGATPPASSPSSPASGSACRSSPAPTPTWRCGPGGAVLRRAAGGRRRRADRARPAAGRGGRAGARRGRGSPSPCSPRRPRRTTGSARSGAQPWLRLRGLGDGHDRRAGPAAARPQPSSRGSSTPRTGPCCWASASPPRSRRRGAAEDADGVIVGAAVMRRVLDGAGPAGAFGASFGPPDTAPAASCSRNGTSMTSGTRRGTARHRRRPRREDPRRPLRPGRGTARATGAERHLRRHPHDAAAGAAAAQRRRADRPAARPRHLRRPAAAGVPARLAAQPRRRPGASRATRCAPRCCSEPSDGARGRRRPAARRADRHRPAAGAGPRVRRPPRVHQVSWIRATARRADARPRLRPGLALQRARRRWASPSPGPPRRSAPTLLGTDVARHLDEPPGAPVLVSDRITYTPTAPRSSPTGPRSSAARCRSTPNAPRTASP